LVFTKNLDKQYDWAFLSRSKSVTFEIVKQHLDKPWYWYNISCNKNITWGIVQANRDMPWVWESLSFNSNITWDIVKDNINEPWDWQNMKINPNITIDMIDTICPLNGVKPLQLSFVNFNNKLNLPINEIVTITKKYFAAKKIQSAFKEAYYNPNLKICRKRLRNEFEKIKKDF